MIRRMCTQYSYRQLQSHAHTTLCSVRPQVLAATRIHNRHLRAQFAKHMDADDAFEYLFYCNPAGVGVCWQGSLDDAAAPC